MHRFLKGEYYFEHIAIAEQLKCKRKNRIIGAQIWLHSPLLSEPSFVRKKEVHSAKFPKVWNVTWGTRFNELTS